MVISSPLVGGMELCCVFLLSALFFGTVSSFQVSYPFLAPTEFKNSTNLRMMTLQRFTLTCIQTFIYTYFKKRCRRERRMAVVERKLHDRKELWVTYLVCKKNEFFAWRKTDTRELKQGRRQRQRRRQKTML